MRWALTYIKLPNPRSLHIALMLEYRIHGRGGQGSVAAAYLLAATAFHAGQMCQAFPAFGAERRGAPVTAFVRTADQPIKLRSQVRRPDFLIVQDGTLLRDDKITEGLKPGGGIVANTSQPGEDLASAFGCRTLTVPATEIAMKFLGRPIPNTALLGAFLLATGIFPIASLQAALQDRFSEDIVAKNLAQLEHVAGLVEPGIWKDQSDA